MSDLGEVLLKSLRVRLDGVKGLGDRTLKQVKPEDIHWKPSVESNSVTVLIQHMHGNMMSRWTDFLTSDGEKEWRDRDGEFVGKESHTIESLTKLWEEGWSCFFQALDSLKPEDLLCEVTIRGEVHTALDAIVRQVAHISYHVGQLVEITRMRRGKDWVTLSIPRGESKTYQPPSQT